VERRRRSRLSNGDKQTRICGPQEERVCRTERRWWYGGFKRRENFRRPRGRRREEFHPWPETTARVREERRRKRFL
jgi:hypothetical protein